MNCNVEYRITDKNGKFIWIESRGRVVEYDEQNRPSRMAGTIVDISDRKYAEESLIVSEARFRALLDNAPNVAIQGYSADGTVTYWNTANEKVYGYTAEEAIGKNLLALTMPPEMRDIVIQAIQQGAETGEMPPASELSLMRRDDSLVSVFSSHVVVKIPGHEPELFCLDLDFTELKRVENALRESNELLETFIKHSPIYAFIKEVTSTESRVLYASENYLELIGIPGSEMIGKTMAELFPAEFAEKITADDWNVACNRNVLTIQEEFNDRSYTSIKFPIDLGCKTLIAGYSIDITESNQAQDALQRSQSELADAQEISKIGNWRAVFNESGEQWFGSDEIYKIYGYPRDTQFTMQTGLDRMHPEDRESVINAWSAAIKGDGPTQWEHRILVDGQIKWLEVRAKFKTNEEGNVTEAFGTAQDITEQKMAERALQETGDLLVEIIEQSPISMAIVSMDGTIEKINCRAIETFGYSPDDIPNMELWWIQAYPDESYRAEVIAQWMGLLGEAIADKSEIKRREYQVTCKDGTVKTVLIFGIPVSDKIFVMFEDITIQKKAEKRIINFNVELEKRVSERTEELERTNKELEEFCYALSHEFRAPIARLEGFGTMLQEVAGEDDKEQIVRCADRIVAAGTRLRTVIDALLVMNRVFRAEMHLQRISLSELADTIMPELIEDGVQRSMNIIIEPDITATGDRYMMEICMRNLLGNAVKYSSKTDEALIEFGRRIINGEKVYFVRDNGVGFDMKYSKDIFKQFCRLHTESEFEGTGVGLATVYRIIEKHNGRIWIDAKLGEGATFYFTLGVSGGEQ